MYVWEYTVNPEHVIEFERAYRSDGTWVDLFRRADGFVRTELHHDQGNPLLYITIDYWTSFEAWEAFRSKFAAEFEQLDAECEGYTEAEREIGRFVSVE